MKSAPGSPLIGFVLEVVVERCYHGSSEFFGYKKLMVI